MAKREPVARIAASLPMDGQECAKRSRLSGNILGATKVVFDQLRRSGWISID
jgi:hypothetical protein